MNEPVFYLTNDPERALGLEKLYKNFHIVCIDDHPMIPYLREAGVRVFSLGETLKTPNPIFRSTAKLMQQDIVREFISSHTDEYLENTGLHDSGYKPNIIVFKISEKIERLASMFGYRLLNASAQVSATIEKKVSQHELFVKYGITIPKSVITTLTEGSYKKLTQKLGTQNLVVQFDRGHSGTGTKFITGEGEYEKIVQKHTGLQVRVSEMLDGATWTINAVNLPEGVLYGGLSFQITGLPGLTPYVDGGTVGNDWSKSDELSANVKDALRAEIENIGRMLTARSYYGLFGVDFMVNADRPVIIEVNARQTASVSMHAMLDEGRGWIPLEAFHIDWFMSASKSARYKRYGVVNEVRGNMANVNPRWLGTPIDARNIDEYMEDYNSHAFDNIKASQILARNTGDTPTAYKFKKPIGVYAGSTSSMLRETYAFRNVGEGEFLYTHTADGQNVSVGTEFSRIQCACPHENIDTAFLLDNAIIS